MATNTIKTTFMLKRGTADAWQTKNPVLAKAEPGFITDQNVLKIGDGVTAFNNLKPIVPAWAQADTKPEYAASEITGLSDYISGAVQDTDTQYKIVKVDDHNYKLQSKAIGGEWTDVTDSTIVIPEYDDTALSGKIDTLNTFVGITGDTVPEKNIPTQITEAQTAAQTYTDTKVNSITIEKKSAANEGFASSYQLKIGETIAGEVDIPKDYLVKSGDLKTVESAGAPYEGAVVGDKYIDFVVNTTDDTGNESHIYIPLTELMAKPYTAGNGIAISATNEISVKVADASNGLVSDESGLHIALASESQNGVIDTTTFTKIQGIADNATKVEASETNGNIKINGTETTVYTIPDDVLRTTDTFIFDGGEA